MKESPVSTKRKIDSARANGAKSRGPATEEGRKKSSMNALKYGLTARTVVLPNENDDEYTFLLESYVEKFQPTDPVEMDLVLEMVNAKWRQRRLYNIETDLFEQQMAKEKEEIEASYISYNESVEHAFAFRRLAESGSLTMLSRIEFRLERTYSRALRDLLRMRYDARKQESEKRTQSQDRTPAVNTLATTVGTSLSPEAQDEWKPPVPQPLLASTILKSSNPATATGPCPPIIPVDPLDNLPHSWKRWEPVRIHL
jgi:hypothetical protein